jgi:hypothetical protein
MALVDVAPSVAATPDLVEVGAQIDALRGVFPGLVDLLLDGGELAIHGSIRSTARMLAQRRCRRLGCRAPFFHQGCDNPEVSHGRIGLERGVGLLETCHSCTQVALRAIECW